MARIRLLVAILLSIAPFLVQAQGCKVKFAVAYADGESLQIGLTAEQKKMWDHESAKKFRSLCVNSKDPDYVVLWSEGLNGAELTKVGLNHFNQVRNTGENPGPGTSVKNFSLSGTTIYLRPSSLIRAKADYSVLDVSKPPYSVVHQGQGYQDVPQGTSNHPGQRASASDLASTIADPVAALENALKWLKKEKKL